jgi:hypothetical protein
MAISLSCYCHAIIILMAIDAIITPLLIIAFHCHFITPLPLIHYLIISPPIIFIIYFDVF